MKGMLPVKATVLVEFKLSLHIPFVLLGGIIPPLTFAALKGDDFNRLRLCHETGFSF